jgi:RNA polymerase sigma factor (sigma-70 family)
MLLVSGVRVVAEMAALKLADLILASLPWASWVKSTRSKAMRQDTKTYLFPGVFLPVLSLDELSAQPDADGFNSFDIADEDTLSPDEQIAQAEGFTAVDAFVNTLTERDQLIVRRLFWLGDTQTQIASDLGVSKMAISKVVARIRSHGRSVLAPYEYLAFNN